ncbi:ISL3 family transposase [Paludisphaera mucosa]|uniref:ISL3 family transposase n=1 Tax=Paludisphaera mucosa TaxID=3030827 RepID=A0ABT6FEJ1_9BACT|nr:ISL3 family transposase [Paludisphaera mucosa]
MTPTSPTAACPTCGCSSPRVRSRYVRRLADLPCRGSEVRLLLTVRRFVCTVETCPRRIFAERLPGLAGSRARATESLRNAQEAIGDALGGEAGSRLAGRLAMSASPDTLLRRVRLRSREVPTTPRALGVDDFAFRKGARYGTILVDLETRRVIDLLPDREATTLSAWLRARPGIEVVARDRSNAYALAAGEAAPAAVQVADRWHLLKNIREALQRALQQRSRAIRELPGGATGSPEPGGGSDPPASRPEAGRSANQEARRSRFEEVRRLHREGASLRAITRAVGVHYRTVERYVRSEACPDWRPGRRGPSRLDRFAGHILRRLDEGCRNARQIRRELLAKGYRGAISTVREYVRRIEGERGAAPPAAAPATDAPRAETPSPRRLAALAVIRPSDRPEDGQRALDALREGDEALRESLELTEGFAAVIRGRRPDDLTGWLARAEGSSVPEMRSFARGLRGDEAAIRAGIELPWSNGPTEGHVNRLKAIKRSMYGRARFDLLRARVLAAG